MKIKKNKKIVGIVALLVLPVVMFYTMEWFLRNPFEKMRGPIQGLNILFFELIALLLLFLTGSIRVAIRIEAVISMLIGLINYFVVRMLSRASKASNRQIMGGIFTKVDINNARANFTHQTKRYSPQSSGSSGGSSRSGGGGGGGHSGGGHRF